MFFVLIISSIIVFLLFFFIGKEYERSFIKENTNPFNKKIMQSLLLLFFLISISLYQLWLTQSLNLQGDMEYILISLLAYIYVIFISIYFNKFFSWTIFVIFLISLIETFDASTIITITKLVEITFIFLVLNVFDYSKFKITNFKKSIYIYFIQMFIIIFTFFIVVKINSELVDQVYHLIIFLIQLTFIYGIILFFVDLIEKTYTNFYLLEEINKKRSFAIYRKKIYKEKIKNEIKNNKYSFGAVLTFILEEDLFYKEEYDSVLRAINDKLSFIKTETIFYELGFNVFGAFIPIENINNFNKEKYLKILENIFLKNDSISSFHGYYSIYGVNSNDIFLIIDEHINQISNLKNKEYKNEIIFYNKTLNRKKTILNFSNEIKKIIDLYEVRLIKLENEIEKSEVHKKYNFFSKIENFNLEETDEINIERYWALKSLKEYKNRKSNEMLVINYPYQTLLNNDLKKDFLEKLETYIDLKKLIINLNVKSINEINDLFKNNIDFLKKHNIKFSYEVDKNSKEHLKDILYIFDYEILEKNKIIKIYN